MKETIYINEIGEVSINYSSSATKIRISVKPFVGVILTVPIYANKEKAIGFLEQKKEWLKKALAKTEKVEDRNTVFDENTTFRTRNHRLQLLKHKAKQISLSVSNEIILVRVPENMNTRDAQVQETARKGIEFALRKEARIHLPIRISELASENGLSYKSVAIKASKTRWGSCSSVNSINLSLHLMRLPERLIDYVILHELAHTIVKNHSDKYWAYLGKICPHAKALDKELSNYSTIYY